MIGLKEKFHNAYSNIPDALRGEIVAIIDGKSYTWNSIYFEVKNNTELSKKLLNTLSELGIL